jgi:sugar lactone lactonase YvrE
MNSVDFGQGNSIGGQLGAAGLTFTAPIVVPSSISSLLVVAQNSIATSNVSLQNFTGMSTLQFLTLSSAQIVNNSGSLVVSSLQGNSFTSDSLTAKSIEDKTTLTVKSISMNDSGISTPMTFAYNGNNVTIPVYWTISSIGRNGTFNAPYTDLLTDICVGDDIRADELDTGFNAFISVFTSSLRVTDTVTLSCSNASMKYTNVNLSGGGFLGNQVEAVQGLHCDSIQTDVINSPSTITFQGGSAVALPDTYISTATLGSATTSSLVVSRILTGSSAEYSTINPSSTWLFPSTYQMGAPFTKTEGLGTYFNEEYFVATRRQTAYYSAIDPTTLQQHTLSTPYVNTVAGTGIKSGPTVSGGQAIGTVIGQPAYGSDGSLYFGATDAAGWKVKELSPSGLVSTLAGQPRYFYGDGGFPGNAALGPRLAISIFNPGQILITDVSNVRLRYITADPIIQTIAGTGQSGFSGDAGPASLATFSTPLGSLVTSYGSTLYLADSDNQRIRIIRGSTISTFAGTGVAGATGDGGPATAATLSRPYALAIDASQNIIFTDLSNCAVRKIGVNGTIQRIAGTYANGYGGDGGLAVNALLSYPTGITVDPFNAVYFCDTGNSRVRRIDPTTLRITTVAGNGVAAFGGDGGLATLANLSSPTGVASDSAGNLYIADRDNQCIRFVSYATGRIATVAGQPRRAGYSGDYSFATFALLNTPTDVIYDQTTQYYYVADSGNSVVRYIDSVRKIIYAYAGNSSPISAGDGGPPSAAVFGNITSVATDTSNNIYISDGITNRIRMINAARSTIQTVVGTGTGGFSGDGGLATAAQISSPQTVLTDSSGALYFTDMLNQRVRRVDGTSRVIQTIAGTGMAVYDGDNRSSVTASLNFPAALTRGPDGSLYVGDTSSFRIRQLAPDGFIRAFAGCGVNGVVAAGQTLASTTFGTINGLAYTSSVIFATDATTSAIWSFNPATNLVQNMSAVSTPAYLGDAGPLSNALFNQPTGIISDTSGNLVICDSENFRLRKTYTFGRPRNPLYLTMNMAYTNYYTSTGSGYIKLNGNTLTTFDASLQTDQVYQVTDLPIFNYPLQSSNPITGDQTPFLEITQADTASYTKLAGNFYVTQVPGQPLLRNLVDSSGGIQMNRGTLNFPYELDGITMDNKFNDASMRTVSYTGSLISASDPALKEAVTRADLSQCYITLDELPLRSYSYIQPYISTFHVRDTHRLGFLTSEVAWHFPNSISRVSIAEEAPWCPSPIDTLDTSQIRYAHLGVTQYLMNIVDGLESEVASLRSTVAQRKSVS